MRLSESIRKALAGLEFEDVFIFFLFLRCKLNESICLNVGIKSRVQTIFCLYLRFKKRARALQKETNLTPRTLPCLYYEIEPGSHRQLTRFGFLAVQGWYI